MRYVHTLVQQNGLELECVLEIICGRDMFRRNTTDWLEAVRKDGWELRYVPKEFCSHKLCLIAVQQDGRILQYVPEELLDRDICIAALQQNISEFLINHFSSI